MGRDLSDSDRIGKLERKLERFMSGALLENSSISDGQLTLIRATLLMMGGSLLKGEGTFDWTGPGSIAGNFEVLDGGVIKVGGVLISPVGGGRIMIGEGPVGIILDGGTGTLTMGNIKMEGGKIYVGTGASQVVIDGATGKILAGNMTMDPTTSGGALVYANGAQVFTDNNTIQVYLGNSVVQVANDYARIQHGGDVFEVNANGLRASSGLLHNHNTMDGRRWVTIDEEGYFGKIDPAFGGPGGGRFEYPFPESTITYGFRPPDRPTHDGLDMAGPGVTGQMIPAAARGVVTFAGGSGGSTGYGYYVIINHGMIDGHEVETLYGHMATAPIVSAGQTVAKGDLLGSVGNTGNSFGDHLHWEIRVDGEPVDPQIFMQQYAA